MYEVSSNLAIAGGQIAGVAKTLCLDISPKIVLLHPTLLSKGLSLLACMLPLCHMLSKQLLETLVYNSLSTKADEQVYTNLDLRHLANDYEQSLG